MKIIELSPTQYEAFLSSTSMGYNFMQSSEFASGRHNQGSTVILAGVEENTVLYAVIALLRPAMRLFSYATSVREWVAATPELLQDEQKLGEFISLAASTLKAKGAIAWLVESNVEYRQHDKNGQVRADGFFNENYRTMLTRLGFGKSKLWKGYDEARQSRWVSWIDLQKDLPQASRGFPLPLDNGLEEYTWTELLKEMAGNTRRSFQKTDLPYLESVVIRGDEDFDLGEFDALLEASAEKHNFGSGSTQMRQDMLKAFGKRGYLCTSYLNMPAYENFLKDKQIEWEAKEQEALQVCEKMPNSKKKRNQLLEIQEQKTHNEKELHELEVLKQNEKQERIPLASGIFLETPSEMVYLFGGSRPDLARYMGPYANQKTMIHIALDHQLQRYNFWGISGNFEPEEDGYGVFYFKKNLGATVGEYAGEFVMPLKPLLAKPFLRKIRPEGLDH